MRSKLLFSILLAVMISGCGGVKSEQTGLIVSPSSVSLWRGESQEFQVSSASSPTIAIDGLGLKWTSDGGSIYQTNGLSATFVAGYKPGNYSVSVSYGKHFGYASVTVY